MKIFNPNFMPPAKAKAEVLKAKLAAWFAANPGVESVTLAQVKAAAPAESAGLTMGDVHQMAREAGWTVDTND